MANDKYESLMSKLDIEEAILSKYKCGEQTWPSDFRAIFEALRQFTTTQIIFYLIPLGLRILKWVETSL